MKAKLPFNIGINTKHIPEGMRVFVKSLERALEKELEGAQLVHRLGKNCRRAFLVSLEAQNVDKFYHTVRNTLVSNDLECKYGREQRRTPIYQRIVIGILPEDFDKMVATWNNNKAMEDAEEEDGKEILDYQYSRNQNISRELEI